MMKFRFRKLALLWIEKQKYLFLIYINELVKNEETNFSDREAAYAPGQSHPKLAGGRTMFNNV